MHTVFIAGVAGTFMAGLARLAVAQGWRVIGWDKQAYSPMKEQLESMAIELHIGDWPRDYWQADVVVLGNALSRGHPLVEDVLRRDLSLVSGPEFLKHHVLPGRRVVAVAGTHGKTTTTALLVHCLSQLDQPPSYLVGGVPLDSHQSAALTPSDWFVIEADEYDTAFFDKRSKFVHYRPEFVIINNLEHDHHDIFEDLKAIQWQFHQMLRVQKASGAVIADPADPAVAEVLARGVWAPLVDRERPVPDKAWPLALQGRGNQQNLRSALACLEAMGFDRDAAMDAAGTFAGVARRQRRLGTRGGITFFEDFAHHPTAIRQVLEQMAGDVPLVAVVEPASNSFKAGAHTAALPEALAPARQVFWLTSPQLTWSPETLPLSSSASFDDVDALFDALQALRGPLCVVLLSNGSFQGLIQRVIAFCSEGAAPTDPE